jgi:hypothetical protein
MARGGLNTARQLGNDLLANPKTHGRVIDEPDERRCSRRLTRSFTLAAGRHPASERDRIVGTMFASRSHDTMPSNCGRGATMGPRACSRQSPPVAFRAHHCRALQGLIASWHDWRRHAASLIRKRSQVRVLDRPLAGIQKFAAVTQLSGFRLCDDRGSLGAPWGHMGPPADTRKAKRAHRFAPLSGGRRLPERCPPRPERTDRGRLEH